MKLELKHLAPYLPYALRIKTKHGFHTMETLNGWLVNGDHEESYSYEDHPNETLEFKPILRPLSDLSKDDFGEYLIEELYTLDFEKQILRILEDIRWVNQCDYLLIQLLIEKHYDVFGLMEKGLAIDINTL
jgi:hypothetical protein